MSRLRELIEELCPDGVEYRKLGEIGTLIRGKRFVKNDFIEVGVPAIHYGELYTHYGISASEVKTHIRPEIALKMRYAQPNDIVIVGAGETIEDIGIGVAWLGKRAVAVHDACYIFHHELNPVFISYILRTEAYHRQLKKYITTGKISSISANGIGQAIIPVPPLPIQNEIVKMLDNFTELTAELTAELALRKKQYNFYRDSLLNFDQNDLDVEWKKIGMIGDVTKLAGFEFTKYVTYVETGKIIALRGLNVKGKLDLTDVKYLDGSDLTKLERSKLYKDDILFTYVGTVGQVALVDCDDKYYLAPNVARIRFDKEVVDPAYIRYFFQTEYFMRKQIEKYAKTSSMKNLTMENIRKFQVPIPPLETQAKIVSILDRFDTLTSDLTQGLPAEIAARKKQYEYYRDKLLTFWRK